VTIQSNIELASRSTLGVGGSARHYALVSSEQELTAALDWAHERKLEVRVLGGGSNVVIADEGVDGLVIELGLRGLDFVERGARVEVTAQAGEPWDELVAQTVSRNLQGLECLSGIPGRVGATPIQNVGAYGQDVSETITLVGAYDRVARKRVQFSAAECQFAYRDSFFKSIEPGRYVVTEVRFSLTPNGAPSLRYAELQRFIGAAPASLEAVRQAVLTLRRGKSMLLDASDPNSRSCGSFFMNPVLSAEAFTQFLDRAKGEGEAPNFPQPDGQVKLSAGWLIERAGFPRGLRDGNVGLSTKHALALVAHAGATARDVRRFAERVQGGVRDRFGVELHPEPVFWGPPRADT